MSRNSFEAIRLVIAILLKTKASGTCKSKRLKHPNRTVNLQAFAKTAINSNFSI